MGRIRRREWWARNRWGVILLPVALALALLAASDRVADFWWSNDLRVETGRASMGETARLEGVTVYQDVDLAAGEEYEDLTTTMGVSLEGLERVLSVPSSFDEMPVPEGSDAYRVRLRLSADEPVTTDCSVILVDAGGARYGDGSDPLSQYSFCTRFDNQGGSDSSPSGEWTVDPVILTAAGAEIDHVLVTYDGVRYVRLDPSS